MFKARRMFQTMAVDQKFAEIAVNSIRRKHDAQKLAGCALCFCHLAQKVKREVYLDKPLLGCTLLS